MAMDATTMLAIQQLGCLRDWEILRIAQVVRSDISSLDELCDYWFSLEDEAFKDVEEYELEDAYKRAESLMARSRREGIGLMGYFDSCYPEMLRNTVDENGRPSAPVLLWHKGGLSCLEHAGLAVIGSREALPECMNEGERLSEEFARRGFNIISGLALGCDTSGHRGAIRAGGCTTAFLPTGLDRASIYPSENKSLADDIVNNGGLLLSEYPIGTKASRSTLIARDRLQAGLAKSVLVVQTGVHGGAMHAVRAALKAHKPVYAIHYSDVHTSNDETCLGNAAIASMRGGSYIYPNSDIDSIARDILSRK